MKDEYGTLIGKDHEFIISGNLTAARKYILEEDMSDEDILKEAIERAILGGWENPSKYYITSKGKLAAPGTVNIDGKGYGVDLHPAGLIFNHNFARALWGDKWKTCDCAGYEPDETMEAWMVHLRAMVIAEDPIKYLGENMQ